MEVRTAPKAPNSRLGQSVALDAWFLNTMPDRGVDFMLHAAENRPDIFDAMVDGQWPELVRGTDQANVFCDGLKDIVDVEKASHALKAMVLGASGNDIDAMLLQAPQNNADNACAPMLVWFQGWEVSSEWKSEMAKVAMSHGADFSQTFYYAPPNLSSRRHTLMSALLTGAYNPNDVPSVFEEVERARFDACLRPVKDLLDLGVPVDARTISTMMHLFEPQEVKVIVDFFRANTNFSAQKALASLVNKTIKPGAAAYLQSLAAREAIDAVTPGESQAQKVHP